MKGPLRFGLFRLLDVLNKLSVSTVPIWRLGRVVKSVVCELLTGTEQENAFAVNVNGLTPKFSSLYHGILLLFKRLCAIQNVLPCLRTCFMFYLQLTLLFLSR